MTKPDIRVCSISSSVVFQKNNEPFGELSNMATQYPVIVNGYSFRTNEALYQASRYPDYPDNQREIIEQKSPMAVKYVSRKHNASTRKDWESVKVKVMRWCLRVKLAFHYDSFGKVLLSTGDKPIVELSKIDSFWGAKPAGEGTLTGVNVLGRLLMELREEISGTPFSYPMSVYPPEIDNFRLFGELVKTVKVDARDCEFITQEASNQPDPDTSNQLSLPF